MPFVQAIKGPSFATGTPKNVTLNGCTLGNTIIIWVGERTNSPTVSSITAAGQNATLLVTRNSADPAQLCTHEVWAIAVPNNGSVAIVINYGGTNQLNYIVAEYSGLLNPPAVVASGQTTSGHTASTSYNLSPTPSANTAVLSFIEAIAGGTTFSGLSGTDRTGVTSVQVELNDQSGVANTTITATVTAGSNAYGMISAAFSLAPVTTDKAFSGDVDVRVDSSKLFSGDADVQADSSKLFSGDVDVQVISDKSYQGDSFVQFIFDKAFLGDSCVQTTPDKFFQGDSCIQTLSSPSYSGDVLVAEIPNIGILLDFIVTPMIVKDMISGED